MTTVGSYAPDFEIPGIDDNVHHLARYLERFRAVGVIVMCNRCPYVQQYLDRCKQIQAEFANQAFTLVGINPNDEQQVPADSFEQMKAFGSQQALNFPYLRDLTQDVVRSFAAQCTPEAFLIDQDCRLCYRGAIDDSPQSPAQVQHAYLQDAIAQLLAGQTIMTPTTEPVGGAIK
jgi:peroxiredoxin